MAAMILGPHTIVVLRAPEVAGSYGTARTADWDNASSTPVSGCSVQPASSGEFNVDRDALTTRLAVYLPADADVRGTDRVLWQGDTYDVDGDVLRWDFPPLSHLVIYLRRSQG